MLKTITNYLVQIVELYKNAHACSKQNWNHNHGILKPLCYHWTRCRGYQHCILCTVHVGIDQWTIGCTAFTCLQLNTCMPYTFPYTIFKHTIELPKLDRNVACQIPTAVVEQWICHWTMDLNFAGSNLTEDRYFFLYYLECDHIQYHVFNMYMSSSLQSIMKYQMSIAWSTDLSLIENLGILPNLCLNILF